jgi:hypothetical protein
MAADPILPAVREVVAQVNPNLPLFDVKTESEQIDRLLFQERLVARLSCFFALLALVLACVGLSRLRGLGIFWLFSPRAAASSAVSRFGGKSAEVYSPVAVDTK